jgi:membrane-associated phospholipid phosphatase
MARMRTRLRSMGVVLLLVTSASASALAQADTTAGGRKVVPRDTANGRATKTLFTYRDAILAGAFTGLTIAMFPVDRKVAQNLQDTSLQANKFFDKGGRSVEFITTPGSFMIGGGLYAFGKIAKKPNVADLGWHGTEAILLASSITSILKGTLGRARPYVSLDTNPHNFKFMRGFGRDADGINASDGRPLGNGDYQSFPSGHTTTAFAAASVVTSETRRLYPGALWVVAPVMYGGATLVGLSRMYHNNHWASDVVLGAAIGTFSGIKVVRYSHAHPDNRIDRMILGATIVPRADGGATVAFSVPVP